VKGVNLEKEVKTSARSFHFRYTRLLARNVSSHSLGQKSPFLRSSHPAGKWARSIGIKSQHIELYNGFSFLAKPSFSSNQDVSLRKQNTKKKKLIVWSIFQCGVYLLQTNRVLSTHLLVKFPCTATRVRYFGKNCGIKRYPATQNCTTT
jgi:hypothetical protein